MRSTGSPGLGARLDQMEKRKPRAAADQPLRTASCNGYALAEKQPPLQRSRSGEAPSRSWKSAAGGHPLESWKEERTRSEEDNEMNLPGLAAAYTTILRALGEDPQRQGLLKTPWRAATAMQYFTKGYQETITGGTRDSWFYKARKH